MFTSSTTSEFILYSILCKNKYQKYQTITNALIYSVVRLIIGLETWIKYQASARQVSAEPIPQLPNIKIMLLATIACKKTLRKVLTMLANDCIFASIFLLTVVASLVKSNDRFGLRCKPEYCIKKLRCNSRRAAPQSLCLTLKFSHEMKILTDSHHYLLNNH